MGTVQGDAPRSSLESVCVELEKGSKVLAQNVDSSPQAKNLENALKVHIKANSTTENEESCSQRLFESTNAFLAALSRAPRDSNVVSHSREFRKWATCVPALVQINGFDSTLVREALRACKSGLAIRSIVDEEENDDVNKGELVSRSTLQSLCARMVSANNCPRASLEEAVWFISSHLIFASDNFILLNLFARTLVRICSSLNFISRGYRRRTFNAAYRCVICLLRIASSYASNIGSVLPLSEAATVPVQQRTHSDNYQSMKVVKFILEHVHSIVDSLAMGKTLGTKLVDGIVDIASKLATLRVSGPEEDSQGQGKTAVSILNEEVIPRLVALCTSLTRGAIRSEEETKGQRGNNYIDSMSKLRATVKYVIYSVKDRGDGSGAAGSLLLVSALLNYALATDEPAGKLSIISEHLFDIMPDLLELIHRSRVFMRISSFDRSQMISERQSGSGIPQGYLCVPNSLLLECIRCLQRVYLTKFLYESRVQGLNNSIGESWTKILTHRSTFVRNVACLALQSMQVSFHCCTSRLSKASQHRFNEAIGCYSKTLCLLGAAGVKQVLPSMRGICVLSSLYLRGVSATAEGITKEYLNYVYDESTDVHLDKWWSSDTEFDIIKDGEFKQTNDTFIQCMMGIVRKLAISNNNDNLSPIVNLRASLAFLLADHQSRGLLQEKQVLQELFPVLSQCYTQFQNGQAGSQWLLCTEAVRYVQRYLP
eukprot:gb/GECG01016105.1/.p1 GENE.gb/GECG01016105.1/~~gb/GECG01016105.1/.p1  ORF type:complete len:713 (+),score=63.45 gb/GECG01016105.1/:1-2139(+)